LEHGYCETAGNKVHLYADSTRWAFVFEKCGYQNLGDRADIEHGYVGNCIIILFTNIQKETKSQMRATYSLRKQYFILLNILRTCG